jgi:hypothetical protein
MIILLKMLAVLTLMVFLLKRKTPFGNAMLASTLLLFLITAPEPNNLIFSLKQTVIKPETWFMIITLYLVMCLEYLLRTSGILKDFTASARKLFRSDRVLLGFMPAFLGFLPSFGGAIFSAPLVKEAAKSYQLSPERLTAINYWFRHVWEFTNPILPAILLASQLTRVPVGTIIANQFLFSIAAIIIGVFVLLTGKSFRNKDIVNREDTQDKNLHYQEILIRNQNNTNSETPCDTTTSEVQALPEKTSLSAKAAIRSILLAAGPIFINILLVVVWDMNTALALILVVSCMTMILKLNIHKIKEMLISSFDFPMLWGVITILFFQQMLDTTGTIDQIVLVFESSGIPAVAIISITAFVIGLLVGSPQGFVAVAFPLIMPLAPGNMDVIAMGYIAGLFGTMTSPAHLCQIVTLQYFKADFIKSLLPIFFMEILLTVFALTYIYIL